MPSKSSFVEHMNKFVSQNIKDKLNFKNSEIVIPSQLRKKEDWNKKFIGSLIKCFYVNGIEKYILGWEESCYVFIKGDWEEKVGGYES